MGGITKNIQSDSTIELVGHKIQVLQTPCHTTGSVCYFFPDYSIVFTGDTIFCGGVGRFFEGTAEGMVAAVKKIQALNDRTQIFPGHECSIANLKFAKFYDCNNQNIDPALHNFVQRRSANKFTIPSSI